MSCLVFSFFYSLLVRDLTYLPGLAGEVFSGVIRLPAWDLMIWPGRSLWWICLWGEDLGLPVRNLTALFTTDVGRTESFRCCVRNLPR